MVFVAVVAGGGGELDGGGSHARAAGELDFRIGPPLMLLADAGAGRIEQVVAVGVGSLIRVDAGAAGDGERHFDDFAGRERAAEGEVQHRLGAGVAFGEGG